MSQGERERDGNGPEVFRAIIVLLHLGMAALEVDDAILSSTLFAEVLGDTLGMGLAGVSALEDVFKVFANHFGWLLLWW